MFYFSWSKEANALGNFHIQLRFSSVIYCAEMLILYQFR
jgi:hypothetical protein